MNGNRIELKDWPAVIERHERLRSAAERFKDSPSWVAAHAISMAMLLSLQGGCDVPAGDSVEAKEGYKIKTIDGCQYIEVDAGFGHSRVYSLTHKGNCTNPIHKHKSNPQAQRRAPMIRKLLQKIFGRDETEFTDCCVHDWEVIEERTYSEVELQVKSQRAGRSLSPSLGSDYDDFETYVHRVCLKCERIENSIEKLREEIFMKLIDQESRQKKAKRIAGVTDDE